MTDLTNRAAASLLLSTKLHRPRLSALLVPRPRLAVRSACPDAGRATETQLKAPTLAAPGRLADVLLHDLIALPGELILVLDDYHTLQTQDVHAVMARVVQHMPTHIHLVLTTRADPLCPSRGCAAASNLRRSAALT